MAVTCVLMAVAAAILSVFLNRVAFFSDPYTYSFPWNAQIKRIRDVQNSVYDVDLPPSMQHAEHSTLTNARQFNQLLADNHDTILEELNTLIDNGYHGTALADTDRTQNEGFYNQRGWRVYWMQLLGTESGTAHSLPTLKRIVDDTKHMNLFQVYVSVFFPPTTDGEVEKTGWNHVMLPLHNGILMSNYRYHYALEIPAGDTGMILSDVQFQWKERHGYIFDDTLEHSAWNLTGKRRVLIIADFPRDLGWFLNGVNQYVFLPLVRHTKLIRAVLTRIATLAAVDDGDDDLY